MECRGREPFGFMVGVDICVSQARHGWCLLAFCTRGKCFGCKMGVEVWIGGDVKALEL